MTEEPAGTWASGIGAITMFVEDLAATRAFYREVFALPVFFEGDTSVVFRIGTTLVNLLQVEQAPELVAPAPVGSPGDGVRYQLTVNVPDVDATCEVLLARGVRLLNGPMDRPWGIRTASFRDPSGHIWEVASGG
jgi:lactoylglutathione lyase